jgi:hypothetical protein
MVPSRTQSFSVTARDGASRVKARPVSRHLSRVEPLVNRIHPGCGVFILRRYMWIALCAIVPIQVTCVGKVAVDNVRGLTELAGMPCAPEREPACRPGRRKWRV